MAIVRGRHIRHDWRTFNDTQDQKYIKTLCGKSSTVVMCGIPTVTPQKFWLHNTKTDKYEWGWCILCTRQFITAIESDDLMSAHPKVMNLYKNIKQTFVVEARKGLS